MDAFPDKEHPASPEPGETGDPEDDDGTGAPVRHLGFSGISMPGLRRSTLTAVDFADAPAASLVTVTTKVERRQRMATQEIERIRAAVTEMFLAHAERGMTNTMP